MSTYTASYTYATDPGDYPWIQGFGAFSVPGDTIGRRATLTEYSPFYWTPTYVGNLIIVEQYVGYSLDETVPGPYAISDSAANDWFVLCSLQNLDAEGNIWWLQAWYCFANEASTSGTLITVTRPPSDGYLVFQGLQCTEFAATLAYVPVGPFALLASTSYTSEGGPPVSGPPSLSLVATNPQLLYSSALALPYPAEPDGLIPVSPLVINWSAASFDGQHFVFSSEYEVFDDSYVPPPPVAPPLRYKRLPLTLQLGSCTFDQANRIAMYELYRSCGLDPTAPFLLALYEWLTQWTPPQSLVLTVWSEAVDEEWNILMQVMPGQVITIDESVSPEWAGDYEVMEKVITPFQGESSQVYGSGGGDAPQGSVEIANAPSQNAGTIALTLRTYNPNVFFDTSMVPSWLDVPGPWADGSY